VPKTIANSRKIVCPTADRLRQSLSRIPTVFGRLTYVASLREGLTGQPWQPDARQLTEPPDRALGHCHYQIFSEWIAKSLEEQKADLEEYIASRGPGVEGIPRYRELIPAAARDVERQLYLTDLETLLELLRVRFA